MENTLYGKTSQRHLKGDSRRIRKEGGIPGIIYGLKNPNMLVEFSEMELFQVISKTGEHGAIKVNLDGKEEEVIIKEVQRNPVTRRINHIDLQRINPNIRIQSRVPVVIRGEEYFKNSGIVIQQQVNEIEVSALPSNLPNYITADVSKLKAKDRITIADLEVSEEISILNNPTMTVVTLANIKSTLAETETSESTPIYVE